MKTKDIVEQGNRFGRWTIKEEVPRIISNSGTYIRRFLCVCDCGNEGIVRWQSLKSGGSKSCGCYMRSQHEKGWKFPKEATSSRLYTIWNSMKQRCYTKSSTSYKRYGAKGIVVCDDWKNNFLAFYKWSLENGYSDDLTIDRIDSKGNYEPSNCRWATYKEQANNTSKVAKYTYNGETHTTREWADIVGLKAMTIRYRIKILNWPIEKALTTPAQKHEKN